MTEDEFTVMLVDLPPRIKAFTQKKDEYYTIFLNACLNYETQLEAYQHELEHITNSDFDGSQNVAALENERHK